MNLIEAISKIVVKREDLPVSSSVPETPEPLERQIHSLGLEDHVVLAGGKPR